MGHIARRGLALAAALVLVIGAAGSVAGESASPSPLVTDDAYATDEDTAIVVPAPGVLSNDLALPTSCTAATDVAGLAGAVTLNPDGSFTYVPAANFNGQTAFRYGLQLVGAEGCPGPFDGQGTVVITVNPVNDAPTAFADSFQALKSTTLNIGAPGVLANDSDVDGDSLSAVKVNNPVHGVVVLAADGAFSYTPSAGFVGADAFSYRASDGAAKSLARVVTIQVTAVPIPTPSPSPTPAPTASPTPEPTATSQPSESPSPEPSSIPAVTFAVTTPASLVSPSPSPAAGPAAHAGGISLPVLLVLVLFGVLLLFGAIYAIPRWIKAQRAIDEPDDRV